MSDAVAVKIKKYQKEAVQELLDDVAAEEPLEIQIQGVGIAVLMRTPGEDLNLVRGFLVTEGIIDSHTHIRKISHCDTVTDPEAEDNIVQVTLEDHVELDLQSLKRNLFANSSCGICGKATIQNILCRQEPLEDRSRFPLETIYGITDSLRERQNVFTRTGGLHAAGLFDPQGGAHAIFEDVGRHNAVDKVIGWMIQEERFPMRETILLVSGRISFEVVQKAAAAQIPVVCGVSAPTSLAVQTAQALNMTLIGFLRGESFNLYSAAERISSKSA